MSEAPALSFNASIESALHKIPDTMAMPAQTLFVSTSTANGGADRLPVLLGKELQGRGIPLLFACRADSFTQHLCEQASIPTVPFRVRNSGDLSAIRILANLIVANRIQIIHAHARRDFVTVVLAVALARIECRLRRRFLPRLILHVHLIRPLGAPPHLSGIFFAGGTDAIIAVSQTVHTFLQEKHSLPNGLVRVLTNGVDTESFAVPSDPRAQEWRETQRSEWGISEETLVLGMVGRLSTKGQDSLLEILPALVQKHDVHVVLVGPNSSEDDQERLRGIAQRLGVEERLTIAGIRSDIPAVMATFDIFVHLPLDEAFGLAIAEAMASGLPTVATDIGGCREILRDGVTGMLVAPNDPAALTVTLLDLLETPAKCAMIGKAARESVVSQFSLEHNIDNLQKIYSELCDTPRH